MNCRTAAIAVLLTSAFWVACISPRNVPTAPTDANANQSAGSSADTSTSGRLPPTAPTAPPAPSGSCDETKAQFVIGERASQQLLDRARVAAGAREARFIRPNEAITLEFSPTRLNLNLNTKDVVLSVGCG